MIPESNKKARLRYQFYNYYKKFLSHEGTWPEEIMGNEILIHNVSLMGVKDPMTKRDYCSVKFIDITTTKEYTIIMLIDGTHPGTSILIFEEIREQQDPEKIPDFLIEEFLKKDQPEERPQIWISM